MSSTATIEVRRRFDSRSWQVAARGPASAPALLVTWQVQPEPVDAAVPPLIQAVLAEALCSLGPCWFAGDLGSGAPVATLSLRRGLSLRQAAIFRAERAAELLPAFEAGAHDWSMAAQWIVVASGPSKVADVLPLVEVLLRDWKLPADWPDEVPLIVQAGVDGDAAGCHCRTPQIEKDLRGALQRSATARGVVVRSIG
jgi:hypothetical protein